MCVHVQPMKRHHSNMDHKNDDSLLCMCVIEMESLRVRILGPRSNSFRVNN